MDEILGPKPENRRPLAVVSWGSDVRRRARACGLASDKTEQTLHVLLNNLEQRQFLANTYRRGLIRK
jgi:hypothetical protein